ncbi:MAG: hypothetical protein RLO80_08030 [Hyphomonas sp.]
MRVIHILMSVLMAAMFGGAAARAEPVPVNEADERAHQSEADLWLDTVFGHCLFVVAGETWSDHPGQLQGEWEDLREDYASTLLKPLYDPKVSASRGAVILDLNEEGTSCWTQYTSLVPDYAGSRFTSIIQALGDEDRLKSAFVDQGNGPQQVGVILIGKAKTPVIFYQAEQQQSGALTVVTIIQKTVPDFVYID